MLVLVMCNVDVHLQYDRTYQSSEGQPKTDSPKLQRGLGAIASSLNYIGGTIGNALEVGVFIVSLNLNI